MAKKTYSETRSIQFPRATFDLSHSHQGSYDLGYLYPIMAEECVPGDTWRIGTQVVARCMPLVAPIMHEINVFIHYWFVPNRIMWPKPVFDEEEPDTGTWEGFITGGPDGDNTDTIPLWIPSGTDTTVGSLWDNFGHPLTSCANVQPTAFHKRAYNWVYNEFYRDENLIEPWSTDDNSIKIRAWEKDYFTASLPFQQRGIAPALPITGTTSAVWDVTQFENDLPDTAIGVNTGVVDNLFWVNNSTGVTNARGALNANTIDMNSVSSFDIADLRVAIQIQRWMERNARAGVRYTEFLGAHYRASPRDDRMQRPEYIGGTKQPVIISEVLQTSETNETPQGEMAGHGISVAGDYAGTYRVQEHGWIIGILSVMPRTMYTQGVNRQFLRRTRYDYYFPEFANLSEQAVLKGELFASGNALDNETIFGYQGRYDELRQRNSRAVGLMRVTTGGLAHWNLARQFATVPSLNQAFIEVESATLKARAWAVPSQPAFVITVGNNLQVNRPLPEIAEPGLIDHV